MLIEEKGQVDTPAQIGRHPIQPIDQNDLDRQQQRADPLIVPFGIEEGSVVLVRGGDQDLRRQLLLLISGARSGTALIEHLRIGQPPDLDKMMKLRVG